MATVKFPNDLTAPAQSVAVITPNDTNPLPGGTCRSIWVGVGGDIAIVCDDGTTAVHKNVPSGIFSVFANKVLVTGTSATNLVAWY